MAGHPKDEEVPNNYFNHAVVAVKSASGNYILMDPTDENTTELLPAYAMNRSYLVATPEGDTLRRTPDVPAAKNLLTIRSQAELDRDNCLHVRSVLEFGGINDNFYRGAFARWPRESIRQFLARELKRAVPGAELAAWRSKPEDFRDLAQNLVLELDFTVKDYADTGWGDGVLSPPFLGGAFGAIHYLLGNTGLEKRRFALETDSSAGVHEEFLLKLPEVMKVSALPAPIRGETGPLHFSSTLTAEGERAIRGRKRLELVQSSIAPTEYAELKARLRQMEAAARHKAVIRYDFAGDFRRKFPHARSVVEEAAIQIDAASCDRFTARFAERRTVLNYGGVKAFSELRIPFYPAWQEVKFLEGEVIAPDGTVQKVEPGSVVVMDRDDGAAAPRYPAGKVMTVSLPGVQPGSRIASRWEMTCRDGNVLAGWYRMDGIDPVLKRSIELSFPETLTTQFSLVPPGPGFGFTRRQNGDRVTVRADGANLSGSAPEPGTPPAWCYAPHFGATAFQYSAFADDLRARTERLSTGRAAVEAAALARELVKEASTPLEKVRIIRDFVAESVREAGPNLNELPLSALSAADVTLKERYGNSADRAILLTAMLKAVEIPAEIVAVSNLPAVPEVMKRLKEMPFHFFTGLLVRVEPEEGTAFYLNDTGRYDVLGAVGHDGMVGLHCATGELLAVEAGAEYRDSIVRDHKIVCAGDGSAEITVRTGYYGMWYGAMHRKFARLTPELKKRFYQEAAATVSEGARLLACSEEFSGYPGTVTMKLRVADFTARSGDFLMLTLPSGGAETLLQTAGSRKLPYLLPTAIDREYRYSVELPGSVAQYELVGAEQQWSAPGASGGIVTERSIRDNRIEIVRKARIPAFYLTAPEYPALEAAQRALSSEAARVILVKVTGK